MKIVLFGSLAIFIGCSASGAAQPAPPPQMEVVRFAAVSVSGGQGARAIISNVIPPGKDSDLSPCQVQVKFFGPDGSLIGDAATVQLKAGESSSVPASQAPRLLRATVSIGGGIEASKLCELKARVEIFDLQTDTTFISVAAESLGGTSECGLTTASISSISGRKVSIQNKKPAVLTQTPTALTRTP
jgi:hypothetical protein